MHSSATHLWLPDLLFTGKRFESGLVLVADARGHILRLSRDPADCAAARRLPNRAILPGLVNTHSHAFHRVIRGRTEFRSGTHRDTFWTWREMMFRAAISLDPDDLYHATSMAFLEMALAGITTVGEFHYLHRDPSGRAYADTNAMAHAIVRAARDVGLRLCLLHCAYARAGWHRTPSVAQKRFIIASPDEYLASYHDLRASLANDTAAGLAWTGFAPHSVRAVPPDYLRALLPTMRTSAAPVQMHICEQTDENEACLAEHDTTPLGLLEREGALHADFTAVHAIHVANHEVGALARCGARVCACPTTERSLGDGICPADTFLARGVPVALGTDTNIQTDLLEDARELECHLRLKHLHRIVLAPAAASDPDPAELASHLLDCATRHGAASLHAPGGALEPGRPADFFTIDLDDPTLAGCDAETLPAALVFAGGRSCIRDVVIGGRPIVTEGRHPRQAEIVAGFRALQRDLWSRP
jgi:formimidoylglutamate deiminase